MAGATMSRPELRAHERAMRCRFEEAVTELRDLLTPRLVAYLGGVQRDTGGPPVGRRGP